MALSDFVGSYYPKDDGPNCKESSLIHFQVDGDKFYHVHQKSRTMLTRGYMPDLFNAPSSTEYQFKRIGNVVDSVEEVIKDSGMVLMTATYKKQATQPQQPTATPGQVAAQPGKPENKAERAARLQKEKADEEQAQKVYSALAHIPPLLNQLINGSGSADTLAVERESLASLLKQTPEVLDASCLLLASSSRDETLEALFLVLTRHCNTPQNCTLFLQILKCVRDCQRFVTLQRLAKTLLPALIHAAAEFISSQQVPSAQPAQLPLKRSVLSGLAVQALTMLPLEQLLLGYQHSPDLLIQVLPQLIALLDRTSSGDKNIVWWNERIMILHLLRCLQVQFSGHDYIWTSSAVQERINAAQTALPQNILAAAAAAAAVPLDGKVAPNAPAPPAVFSRGRLTQTLANARWSSGKPATAGEGWIEGDWVSKSAGGAAMKWSVLSSIEGQRVRGVWRRSVGAGKGKDIDSAHNTNFAGLHRGSSVFVNSERDQYVPSSITDTRQEQILVRVNGKDRWVYSDALLYDAPLPADQVLAQQLNVRQQPLFVLAKRGSDNFFSRGLAIRHDMKQQQSGEVLVRFLDRREDWFPIRDNRVRLYRPVMTKLRSDFDIGSLNTVLFRNARGNPVLEGHLRFIHTSAGAPFSAVFNDGETFISKYVFGDDECAYWLGSRQLLLPPPLTLPNTKVAPSFSLEPASLLEALCQPALAASRVSSASLVRFDNHEQDFILCGGDNALAFHEQQPFTVEALVRLDQNPSTPLATIISKYNKGMGPADWSLTLNAERQVVFLNLTSTAAVPVGQWTHVAASFDGLVGRIYIDGQLAKEAEATANSANPKTQVTIGAQLRDFEPVDFFPGSISEVRVWSEARPQIDLASYARRRLTGFEPGLLAYWPLMSLFGVVNDVSALQNHGAVVRAESAEVLARNVTGVWYNPRPASSEGKQDPLGDLSAYPVLDQFHTRVGDFLLAGRVAPAAGNAGLVLHPPVTQHLHRQTSSAAQAVAVLAPTTGAASAASNAQVSIPAPAITASGRTGAAVWQRRKQLLDRSFTSNVTLSLSRPDMAVAVAFHLQSRDIFSMQPLPLHPSQAASPAFTQAAVSASYAASMALAPGVTGLSVSAVAVPIAGNQWQLNVEVYSHDQQARHLGTLLPTLISTSVHKVVTSGNSTLSILYNPQRHAAVTSSISVLWDGHLLCEPRFASTLAQLICGDRAERERDSSCFVGISSAPLPVGLPHMEVAPVVTWQHFCNDSPQHQQILQQQAQEKTPEKSLTDQAVSMLAQRVDTDRFWTLAIVSQLRELERWMHPGGQRSSWKVTRAEWLEALHTIRQPRDLVGPILQLYGSVVYDAKARWDAADRTKWENAVNQAQTITDFAQLLLVFEEKAPSDLMISPWRGVVGGVPDAKAFLREALTHIRDADRSRRRLIAAGKLAEVLPQLMYNDPKPETKDAKDSKDGKELKDTKDNKVPVGPAQTTTPQTPAVLPPLPPMEDVDKLWVCSMALRQSNDDIKAAQTWVFEKEKQIRSFFVSRQYDKSASQLSITSLKLDDPQHPSLELLGMWETSRGSIELCNDGPFRGLLAQAIFPMSEGYVRGFLSRNLPGGWSFFGEVKQQIYRFPGSCQFEFNAAGDKMNGWWWYGPAGAEWTAERTNISDASRSSLGYAGLLNLGNTCYQNAYLQSLFMTKALRRQLMAVPMTRFPGDDRRRAKRSSIPPVLANDGVPRHSASSSAASASASASASAPATPTSTAAAPATPASAADMKEEKKEDAKRLKDHERQKQIVQRMQGLFAALELSQRPTINQAGLKHLLKDPYNGDRQHDSKEYGGYMLSQIEEGLKGTPMADLVKNVFGGKLRTVLRCQECKRARSTEESLTELNLEFPKLYQPITSIVFIDNKDGKIETPEGYDRIPVDMHAGRPRVPQGSSLYMCVKREAGKPPITDIIFWHDHGASIRNPGQWKLVTRSLNDGGAGVINLGYVNNPNASPITMFTLLTDNKEPPSGFFKIPYDLNQFCGASKPLFLAFKRATPIKDIKLQCVASLDEANRRLTDGWSGIPADDINIKAYQGGSSVFMQYTAGGSDIPITDIKIRRAGEEKGPLPPLTKVEPYAVGKEKFEMVISRGNGVPIVGYKLFRAPEAAPKFGDLDLVELCPGMQSDAISSSQWKMENGECVDWERVDQPDWTDIHTFEGTYDLPLNSKTTGIIYPRVVDGQRVWYAIGTWKQHDYKVPNPLEFKFTPTFDQFAGHWMTGSKKGVWTGSRNAVAAKPSEVVSGPVIGICVLTKGHEIPAGWTKVTRSMGNLDGTLTRDGHCLCIQRGTLDDIKNAVTDVKVLLQGVEEVPAGYQIATLNNGTEVFAHGGDGKLVIAYSKTPRADRHVLWDLAVCYGNDKLLPGYGRISTTPVQMPADFFQHQTRPYHVLLAPLIIAPKTKEQLAEEKKAAERHPIEQASWKSVEQGTMTFKITGTYRAYYQSGTYGNLIGTRSHKLNGVMFQTKTNYRWAGFNTAFVGQVTQPGYLEFTFDTKLTEMKGNRFWADANHTWNGVKDQSVVLGLSRNYRIYYKDGKEMFSSDAGGNNITSMLRNYFGAEVLDKSNWPVCEDCKKKTPAERIPCVRSIPNHLVLMIKRFDWDYRMVATKILEAVDFEHTIRLPVPDADLTKVVFENDSERKVLEGNQYGIYAVVVHVGAKLDGGHYYAYARDSEADLSVPENPNEAPWVKYDDHKIIKSSWKEMRDALRNSNSDTAYILFYRRIDNFPHLSRAKTRIGTIKMDEKGAVATTPLADDAPLIEPKIHVSAALAETISRDNEHFVRELSVSSPHFLRQVQTNIRQQTRFTGEWKLEVPVNRLPVLPSGSCAICTGPAHGSSPCPYGAMVMLQCPACKTYVPSSDEASHFIAPPAGCKLTPVKEGRVCSEQLLWGQDLAPPEPELPAGMQGYGGTAGTTAAASSGGAPTIGSAAAASGAAGLECPICHAVFPNDTEFVAHAASTGHLG